MSHSPWKRNCFSPIASTKSSTNLPRKKNCEFFCQIFCQMAQKWQLFDWLKNSCDRLVMRNRKLLKWPRVLKVQLSTFCFITSECQILDHLIVSWSETGSYYQPRAELLIYSYKASLSLKHSTTSRVISLTSLRDTGVKYSFTRNANIWEITIMFL